MNLKRINQNIKKTINLKYFRIVVSIIFLFLIVGAMISFVLVKKISFLDWLMINSCLSIAFPIFIIGYFFNNKIIMVTGCIFMFRYAILGGLFGFLNGVWINNTVFQNIEKILDIIIIATIFHILMLFITITTIVDMIKMKKIKELIIGTLIGIILLTPLMIYQQKWITNNPNIIEELLINK